MLDTKIEQQQIYSAPSFETLPREYKIISERITVYSLAW